MFQKFLVNYSREISRKDPHWPSRLLTFPTMAKSVNLLFSVTVRTIAFVGDYIVSPLGWKLYCRLHAEVNKSKNKKQAFLYRGGERLLVLGEFPVAVQRRRQNAEDGHFHAVCHPTQTGEHRQFHLELAESEGVHRLRHRVRLCK